MLLDPYTHWVSSSRGLCLKYLSVKASCRVAGLFALRQVVANGQGHVSAQAQQQMNDVLAQLSAISVEEADLSTDSAKTSLNAAIASGGFVGGSQLLPSQLISFNGVFRGIALMIGGELRGPAVEFKSSYAQMPEDQLMQLYEMHPEVNSQDSNKKQNKPG